MLGYLIIECLSCLVTGFLVMLRFLAIAPVEFAEIASLLGVKIMQKDRLCICTMLSALLKPTHPTISLASAFSR